MIERLSTKVFSEEFKNKTERIFVTLSIVSFVIHLLLIFLKYLEILNFSDDKLLTNPIAAILSVAMMLKYSFDLNEESLSIENSIEEVLSEGYRTHDLEGSENKKLSTSEMGNKIIENLQ